MKQILWGCLLGLIFSSALGVGDFYCPRSGTVVSIGDGLDKVINACGAPAKMTKKMVQLKKTQKQEQWVFDYQMSSFPMTGKVHKSRNLLLVNFHKAKVMSITAYGQPVQSTYFCNKDKLIEMGDSRVTVRFYCGVPSTKQYINHVISDKTVPQVILTYQHGQYVQPTTIVVDGGKIASINAHD